MSCVTVLKKCDEIELNESEVGNDMLLVSKVSLIHFNGNISMLKTSHLSQAYMFDVNLI